MQRLLEDVLSRRQYEPTPRIGTHHVHERQDRRVVIAANE